MHRIFLNCLAFIALILVENHVVFSSPVQARDQPWRSITFPETFDWRTKGVVTPVSDLEHTPSSSVTIVTIETIESLHAIATGELKRGSFARVVDCCPSDNATYQCIQSLGGICASENYSQALHRCNTDACVPFATFDHLDQFHAQNDSVLVGLIQVSTLMVIIDASEPSFMSYEGGIYEETNCSQTAGTHALQLVGYGRSESGELYWTAKNSWGQGWGEQGYIRILRGENICGIATQVSQPSITISPLPSSTTEEPITSTSPSTSTRSRTSNNSPSNTLLVLIAFMSTL